MKNNKGFSLVELIIVIAIMAILVGVMAPQLIKYIEKTNVSADYQTCDTIKSALTTAMMDPSVVQATDYVQPTSGEFTAVVSGGGTTYATAVQEILGCPPADMYNKLKSKQCKGKGVSDATIQVIIVSDNAVHVKLTGSYANGKDATGGEIYVD